MQLAGKYQDLRKWAETAEATGGQYPTLKQELRRLQGVVNNTQPGTEKHIAAVQAIQEMHQVIAQAVPTATTSSVRDIRDYPLEYDAPGNPIFWASQTLPLGVTIDEAIKQGAWHGKTQVNHTSH